MCWKYYTHTICTSCRAIQSGVCTLVQYRDPACEQPCAKPWPEGEPEINPILGYVDPLQCLFCPRISEPGFLEEKAGQEDFVREELERMRALFGDRAEGKRKRREKRKKKKKKARGEVEGVEVDGDDGGRGQEVEEQGLNEKEADERELVEQDPAEWHADGRDIIKQGGDDRRPARRYNTRQRQRSHTRLE